MDDFKSAKQKIIRSSAKRRWDILKPLEEKGQLISLLAMARLKAEDKLSITNVKRNGESGSPYLKPFELGKKPCGVPLIETENFGDSRQQRIQLIQVSLKWAC